MTNNLGKKKTNTIWSHLYVESKKINNDNNNINPNSPKKRSDLWLPEQWAGGGGCGGELKEGNQKVQTSSNKSNKY